MRQRHKALSSATVLKFFGVAVVVSLTSACSADVLRFSDSPFANPFQGRADTATTGAVNAPIQKVRTSTLGSPPSYYQSLPKHVGTTGQVVTATSQVAGPVSGSVAGWTAAGGTPVRAGAGDTVEALSSRYGVPVSALRSINGLSGGSQPGAGQQIIIPAYNPSAIGKTAAATAATATTGSVAASRLRQPDAIAKAASRPVEPLREAKSRAAQTSKQAKAAVSKDDDEDEPVKARTQPKPVVAQPKPVAKAAPAPQMQTPKQTTAKTAAVQPKVKAAPKADDDEDEDEKPAKAPSKSTAAAKPARPAESAKPAPKVAAQPAPEKLEVAKADKSEPETTGSVDQEFRWPARGRVISGYGAKGPSGANDGINIALPEGTPIKAAEGGTVAYAGDEIKGYGKMVLIRHPNGYVSAYAHNGDLNVKRGEAVKRGQVIAKSGQSGNVTSPQLHFELRKGSAPVDPSKYLEGN
jgi:murein DD-endopeptidase MepM/ murein hydrolase activator NlpD